MNRRAMLTALPAALTTVPALLLAAPARAHTTRAQILVAAAREQTRHPVTYEGAYTRIPYPMGDVAPNKGVCTDVVIRAYRSLGIDLQERVHQDMAAHFSLYPKAWGLSHPDSNIDHRRVPNLRVFLSRFGASLPMTQHGGDYAPGDLVTYRLAYNLPHIAIVSDSRTRPDRYRIIHNIGAGPQEEDSLLDYDITGHYRYAL